MKTTQEIYDETIAQIEAQTGKTIPLPKRALTRILTWAFAGVVQIVYRRIEFIALQMFPQFASTKSMNFLGYELIPLEMLGIKNGTGTRKSLRTQELNIVSLVTTDGATITAGTTLTSQFGGVSFEVVEDTVIASQNFNWPPSNPTAQDWQIVRVRSTVEGSAGALLTGELLIWDVVPTGFTDDEAQQYEVLIEGTDAETWDDYRDRVLLNEQSTPQGGALYDYYLWATSVNGVVDAYPYTGDPGEVVVYCEGPDVTAPSATTLANVEAAINLDDAGLASRRPAGARVTVNAITVQTADVSVFGLVAPDIVEAKANIQTAIESYFETVRPYIEGVSQPPRNNILSNEAVRQAVYNSVAEDGGSVTGVILNVPRNSIILENGDRYKLGTIFWL